MRYAKGRRTGDAPAPQDFRSGKNRPAQNNQPTQRVQPRRGGRRSREKGDRAERELFALHRSRGALAGCIATDKLVVTKGGRVMSPGKIVFALTTARRKIDEAMDLVREDQRSFARES